MFILRTDAANRVASKSRAYRTEYQIRIDFRYEFINPRPSASLYFYCGYLFIMAHFFLAQATFASNFYRCYNLGTCVSGDL